MHFGGKRPKLFAFDILAVDSESLCHLSYDDRIKKLNDLMNSSGLKSAIEKDLI